MAPSTSWTGSRRALWRGQTMRVGQTTAPLAFSVRAVMRDFQREALCKRPNPLTEEHIARLAERQMRQQTHHAIPDFDTPLIRVGSV